MLGPESLWVSAGKQRHMGAHIDLPIRQMGVTVMSVPTPDPMPIDPEVPDPVPRPEPTPIEPGPDNPPGPVSIVERGAAGLPPREPGRSAPIN